MRHLIVSLTTSLLASIAMAADTMKPGIVKGTIEHPVWTHDANEGKCVPLAIYLDHYLER